LAVLNQHPIEQAPIAVAVNDTALQDLVCAGYDAETIQFR
jgi:hypothetical protein